MPGPSSQRSKKSKNKAKASTAPASSTPDAYIGDIDNAVGWNIIVDILCEGLELPGEYNEPAHYSESPIGVPSQI